MPQSSPSSTVRLHGQLTKSPEHQKGISPELIPNLNLQIIVPLHHLLFPSLQCRLLHTDLPILGIQHVLLSGIQQICRIPCLHRCRHGGLKRAVVLD
ncbi:hypothetical protein GYH30_050758 [Glycine max]|nr:hypothetical protein GYH30_050758 [Glycine max]